MGRNNKKSAFAPRDIEDEYRSFALPAAVIKKRQFSLKKFIPIATSTVIIAALIVSILLPLAQVRAQQVLTWTTDADFTYNKASQCQSTNSDNLEISSDYTDATCSASGTDAALSLAQDGDGQPVFATSQFATFALKQDGTVWAWGDNTYGQLGDGTNTQRNLPVQVKDAAGTGYLTGVKVVVAGQGQHVFAIKNDGTVWAWGRNTNGQLGDNTTADKNLPVRVKDAAGTGFLSDIKSIQSGTASSVALKNDGTVWAWGDNTNGQLGDNTTTQRLLPGQVKDTAGTGFLSNVGSIAYVTTHVLALKTDGTVWAWGGNNQDQLGDGTYAHAQKTLPAQVKDAAGTGFLSGITAINVGFYTSYAIGSDGAVWAWGWNQYGQLGNNTIQNKVLPTRVKDAAGTGFLGDIAAISGGFDSTLALKNDGTVWTWGGEDFGQLGDNTATQARLPVQVKDAAGTGYLTGITAATAGYYHALALKNDGTVYAWGYNARGQLGNNTTNQSNLPTKVKDAAGTGFLTGVAASTGTYFTSGTLDGLIVDVGAGKKTKWFTVDWQTAALAAGTSIVFSARTSDNGTSWSGWSSGFTQSTESSTVGTGDLSSLPLSRYIELRATLATSDPANTPTLQNFSLAYMDDTTAPTVNASSPIAYSSHGGAIIAGDAWTNSQTPYFDWTPGEDDGNGGGIKGYCLYLGQDDTADVTQTKGLLGVSPVDTGDVCQYAISTASLDTSVSGILAAPLPASSQPYYLLIRAIDQASNLYVGSVASTSFRLDTTAPTSPAFVSSPSQFVASKAVTLTWPTSGDQAPSDSDSGIAGLQYRIGTSGTWYGDNHTGTQDKTDVLANDGSYTLDAVVDYPLLNEGNNVIYFRTLDAAGNISSSYNTAAVKINTSAPTSPQNIAVTPETNTANSFAFSWDAPSSFVGTPAGLTYCYSINTVPTSTNCTFTTQRTLAADAFATQPGTNTMYIVAKDEAGNINYDTYASIVFTANTPAPGMPISPEIADISTKASSTWKLALSWTAPTNTGAGIARYAISRSTDGVTYTQLATTAGLSYVDSALEQREYSYKVKACDSANNCGAFSEAIAETPTGRYTTAPELVTSPSVEVSTKSAAFYWVTDRESDSRVQYGTESSVYFPGEVTVSTEGKTHSVDLQNLEAGTTYYYRVKWTDTDGNTGTSSELTFTTLPAPSIQDVNVVKTTLNSSIIDFTSTDASKVTMYYGKTESFGGVESINTSRSKSTYSMELTGLDDGATYFYKFVTYDGDGNIYDSRRTDTFATPPRPRISNVRFQPVNGEPTSTQKVTWTTNVPTNSIVTYGKQGTSGSDTYLSEMTLEHDLVIKNLQDNSQYFLIAQGRDDNGNLAVSDRQTFRTALDTRPPEVSNIVVETAVKGTGSDARGQIIVSWHTDEPATSQVAYAVGGGSGNYNNRSAEDLRLTTDHIVIVSDLPVSSIYHLQPVSYDQARNSGEGKNQSAIIGRATENVLTIILNSLYKVFGL